MKQSTTIFLLLLAVLLRSATMAAKEADIISKDKKIKKHYTVHTTDTLELFNSFGTITINTWNKSEVTVEAIATAHAKTKKRAQEIIDNITFKEETTLPHKIAWATSMETPYNNNNGVNGIHLAGGPVQTWEASPGYTVYMPKHMALTITNHKGTVTIGDFNGILNLKITDGTFHIKRLSGPGKHIMVNGCSGMENTITSIEAGVLMGNVPCALTIAKPIDKSKVELQGYWSPLIIDKTVAKQQ